jgi:hypothetical protein
VNVVEVDAKMPHFDADGVTIDETLEDEQAASKIAVRTKSGATMERRTTANVGVAERLRATAAPRGSTRMPTVQPALGRNGELQEVQARINRWGNCLVTRTLKLEEL